MTEKISQNYKKENLSETPFIVIEGSDGCGKQTQTEMLVNRLVEDGHEVEAFAFPNYSKEGCYFVERYLKGDYGEANDVDPKLASVFFTLDRLYVKDRIEAALSAGKIIVSDRFSAANFAHQGAKIKNDKERGHFFKWLTQLEEVAGIPQPTLYLVLNVPFDVSQTLLKKRQEGESSQPDIHERDVLHQQASRQVYLDLCRNWPKTYKLIDCPVEAGKIAAPETIHELVYKVVCSYLLK